MRQEGFAVYVLPVEIGGEIFLTNVGVGQRGRKVILYFVAFQNLNLNVRTVI
jgi:hypothetical protein